MPIRSADYLRGPLPRASFVRLGRPLKVQTARLRFLSCALKPDFMDRLRRAVVLSETRRFQQERQGATGPAKPFRPGEDPVRYAGRYFDEKEALTFQTSTRSRRRSVRKPRR
jgi:hypothetical protein